MTPIRLVEDKIVRHLVKRILKKGYRVAVSLDRGYDLDEMLLGSTNEDEIVKACFAGDDAHLFVQPETGPVTEPDEYGDTGVVSVGWVYVVFGNGGWDVINDYTTSIEKLVEPSEKYALTFSE